jgi:hypothetical protein
MFYIIELRGDPPTDIKDFSVVAMVPDRNAAIVMRQKYEWQARDNGKAFSYHLTEIVAFTESDKALLARLVR